MQQKKFLKLVESIKTRGMQNPIVVQKDRDYIVNVGHNRVAAAVELGFTNVSIIVSCKEQLEGEELNLRLGLDKVMPQYHPMDNTWIYGGTYFRILRRSTYAAIY